MGRNKNKSQNNVPLNETLRDEAVEETLDRMEELESDPKAGPKTLAVGNRTLSQFLGVYDPSLKKQLLEGSTEEQNQLAQRYLERLEQTDSVVEAGNDLSYCLQYGLDYDLKLTRIPRPGMHFGPQAPGLGGGGGSMMGTGATMPPQQQQPAGQSTYSQPPQQDPPPPLPDEEDSE